MFYIEKIGPAVLLADGTNEWWINGKLHREDGPAIEYPNGDKFWYKNGKRHREDGPAFERSDEFNDFKMWCLNDKSYGYNNDFTNDSWSKFVKTLIFS